MVLTKSLLPNASCFGPQTGKLAKKRKGTSKHAPSSLQYKVEKKKQYPMPVPKLGVSLPQFHFSSFPHKAKWNMKFQASFSPARRERTPGLTQPLVKTTPEGGGGGSFLKVPVWFIFPAVGSGSSGAQSGSTVPFGFKQPRVVVGPTGCPPLQQHCNLTGSCKHPFASKRSPLVDSMGTRPFPQQCA